MQLKQNMESAHPVTRRLQDWCEGNPEALNRIFTELEPELKMFAHHALRGQRRDATLRSAALLNEVMLRLLTMARGGQLSLAGREHFFSLFAKMVRTTFTDELRRKYAQKRGAGIQPTPECSVEIVDDRAVRYGSLRMALDRLDAADHRVYLAFFYVDELGYTLEEAAELAGVSATTVRRDRKLAKAFLRQEIGRIEPELAKRFILKGRDGD